MRNYYGVATTTNRPSPLASLGGLANKPSDESNGPCQLTRAKRPSRLRVQDSCRGP
jgi:hypothetical protein